MTHRRDWSAHPWAPPSTAIGASLRLSKFVPDELSNQQEAGISRYTTTPPNFFPGVLFPNHSDTSSHETKGGMLGTPWALTLARSCQPWLFQFVADEFCSKPAKRGRSRLHTFQRALQHSDTSHRPTQPFRFGGSRGSRRI